MGYRRKIKRDPQKKAGTTTFPHQELGKGSSDDHVPQQACSNHPKSVINNTESHLPAPTFSSASKSRLETLTQGKKVNNDRACPDGQRVSSPQKTWYGKTWPSVPKSLAITQIVKESVSAVSMSAFEPDVDSRHALGKSSRPVTPSKSPAASFARDLHFPNPASPSDSATTTVHTSFDTLARPPDLKVPTPVEVASPDRSQLQDAQDPLTRAEDLQGRRALVGEAELFSKEDPPLPGSETNLSWLAWFSRTVSTSKQNTSSPPAMQVEATKSVWEHSNPITENPGPSNDVECLLSSSKKAPITGPVASVSPAGQARPWLAFWNTSSDDQVATDEQHTPQSAISKEKEDGIESANTVPSVQDDGPQNGALGRWSFWSRPKPLEDSRARPCLADGGMANPTTQSYPEDTSSTEDNQVGSSFQAFSQDAPASSSVLPKFATSNSKASKAVTASSHTSTTATLKVAPSEICLQASDALPVLASSSSNILLPHLKETFGPVETPGWLHTFSRYLSYSKDPASKHVHLQDPPQIKKAIAIGVHGYFPAPLIRSILGQPTGTSVKFADMAEGAIQRWTRHRGYSCDIAKVALEGEGRIGERVDLLWKLMLNWLDDIRKADFIFVACHSQGVPVAVMLVAKLISFGCINGARVVLCAMAGVNLGPFPEYKSRWIGGSAGELFDFAKRSSTVTSDYIAALRNALRFGAKVVYVGSIDDQLVSLEVRHPTLLLNLYQTFL